MAKGIRFFMDAEDEQAFAENALQHNDVVLTPEIYHSPIFPEFRYPREADTVKWRSALVIWNKAICGQVTIKQYGLEIFHIETDDDPVVKFSRSSLHGRILVAGALAADVRSLDLEKGQFVHKGEALEKWYNSLARWIRRNYKRESNYGIYVGPKTQKSVERKEIELAPFLIARDST